jgi:hypothetical protein
MSYLIMGIDPMGKDEVIEALKTSANRKATSPGRKTWSF